MMKTYDVTCPDCGEDFEVEMDPATEEECVDCPECLGEFDWEYIEDTDTVELIPYEIDDTPLADDDDAPLADDDEEEDELA
jgi:peptide subunit release factor 1 (eRF1)